MIARAFAHSDEPQASVDDGIAAEVVRTRSDARPMPAG
jgi:hypothetical protein